MDARPSSPIYVSSDDESDFYKESNRFINTQLGRDRIRINQLVEQICKRIEIYHNKEATYFKDARANLEEIQRTKLVAASVLNELGCPKPNVTPVTYNLISDDSEDEQPQLSTTKPAGSGYFDSNLHYLRQDVSDTQAHVEVNGSIRSGSTVQAFEKLNIAEADDTGRFGKSDTIITDDTVTFVQSRSIEIYDNSVEEEEALPTAESFGYPSYIRQGSIFHPTSPTSSKAILRPQKRNVEEENGTVQYQKKPRISPDTSPIARAFSNCKPMKPTFSREHKSAWTFDMSSKLFCSANVTSKKDSFLTENQEGVVDEENIKDASFYFRCLLGFSFESRIPSKCLIKSLYVRLRCMKSKPQQIMVVHDMLRRLNGVSVIRKDNCPLDWMHVNEQWFDAKSGACFWCEREKKAKAKTISVSNRLLTNANEASRQELGNYEKNQNEIPQRTNLKSAEPYISACPRILGISFLVELLGRDYVRLKDAQRKTIVWFLLSPNIYSNSRIPIAGTWLKNELRCYENTLKDKSELRGTKTCTLLVIHKIQRVIGIVFQLCSDPRDFTDKLVEIYIECYMDLSSVESKTILVQSIEPAFVRRKLLEAILDMVSVTSLDGSEWTNKPLSLAKIFYFYYKQHPSSDQLEEHVMLLSNIFRYYLEVEIPELHLNMPSNTYHETDETLSAQSTNIHLSDADLAALADSSSVVDILRRTLESQVTKLSVQCRLRLNTVKSMSKFVLAYVLNMANVS